jgi:hypothetical protein
MKTLSNYSIPVIVLTSCFLIFNLGGRVLADYRKNESMGSFYKALSEKVEKGTQI